MGEPMGDSRIYEQQQKCIERYLWLRMHGCILLPQFSGDKMLTARMLEDLDAKIDALIKSKKPNHGG